jgi:hypothetical protein
MPENSPSKVAAADHPLIHFISTAAVVNAESMLARRPVHDEDAPGSVWKVATTARARSELKSCADAARPRNGRIVICIANGDCLPTRETNVHRL